LFGKTPFKAQNDYIFQTFLGGKAPLLPPGYVYDLKEAGLEKANKKLL